MLSKDNLVLIGTMILENRTSNEIREIFTIGNGNLTRFRKALCDSALTPEKMEKMEEAELQILVYGSAKTGASAKPAPHFEEIYGKLKTEAFI